MKKYLLLTVLCVLGLFGTLKAQQTTFSYDFESGTLDGWYNIDADGDGNQWQVAPPNNNGAGVGNSYGIVSYAYTNNKLYPDNYVVTSEKYAITATSKLTLNHINYDPSASYCKEGIAVEVSEDGTNFEQLWSEKYAAPAEDWYETTVDLAAYAGKELHIAIRHYNCHGDEATALKVDNIVLTSEGGSEGGEGGEEGEEEEETPESDQPITIGEDGEGVNSNLPTQMYYEYSLTQQIYTGAEMNFTPGNITKIAFFQIDPSATLERDVVVYMVNTDKEIFENNYDWVPVTSADIVYEGKFTTGDANSWIEIELQNPFVYAGGNFVICMQDNTGAWYNQVGFKTFIVESGVAGQGRTLNHSRDGQAYDINALAGTEGYTDVQMNTLQLTIISEPGLSVNPKDGIDFGTIQLGNYWPEKAEASVNVSVSALERTVESITCNNDFFVLPTIDLTAAPIKFAVGYDKDAAAGTYNGTLTITAVEGDVVEVPMTAVVYDPVEPDVFELAREITFTNDAYSDTPDFTTLHDDYVLPNEGENGLAPDAVYSFSLEGEKIIKAEVEGNGGFYAIYKADSIGEGKGTQANNNYNGVETVLSTAFEYDFEDGSLDAFTVQDLDEYKDYCWYVEDGKLRSKSFDSWGEYGTDTWGSMNKADERVITNEAYTITPNTVLTLDMDEFESGTYLNLIVEVTQDGENFVELTTFQTPPYYFKEDYMKDYYPEYFDENGNFITLKRADLGALFIAKGLEYGDYRISLHANNGGGGDLLVDNVVLTERAGVYEAGDYYLVAAAKEAFTLNVELQNVGGNEPVDPEVKDYRIASIEGIMNTVYTYESENSNKVVEINSDGLIDVLDYNEDGTLAGYTTTSGTDVITEVEYIYENGKLAGYSEVAQGWTGPITEDATFVYNAEGQITEIVSSKMTTQLTYNAEGLVTEKLLLYGEDIDSKEVYDYENGNLIRLSYFGYDAWETMDFYLGEVYEYEYDVNGNCIKENQYFVNDDESWTLFCVNEISHNMTVAYEDVFYFEYPHLAILNPAEPSHNNIITKEYSYYLDGDTQHSHVETIYTYNPELPADEPTVPAPTNLVAEALSETEIKLTWDSEEVDGFTIYQNGEIVGLGLTVTEYTVTGLTAGTEYCFTVTAVIGDEESAHSNEACATTNNAEQGIGAPTNITAVATGANSILLSWDAVEGAAGYGVYCDGEWLAGFYNTVLEYEFVGFFDPETTYCFAMTTITEIDAEGYIVGETEPSDDVCATTEASSVLPPTNIVAEAISDTEIRLSWDAADGALGYGIYMDGQFAGAIQETSIVFDQLAPDTEYCFAVFSVSEIDAEGYIVGFSATSDEVCATTKGIGVEEFSTAFNIYPNPVNDVLFIENGNNIEEVSIYTITGVMVYSEQCVSNNVQVNVSELEGGVYIIKVRTENNEIINRFVKK